MGGWGFAVLVVGLVGDFFRDRKPWLLFVAVVGAGMIISVL